MRSVPRLRRARRAAPAPPRSRRSSDSVRGRSSAHPRRLLDRARLWHAEGSRHARVTVGVELGGGQPQRKARAAADVLAWALVEQPQLSAHACGKLASDREPQAEPAVSSGRASALEALEDLLALGGGHAGAAVAD